MPQKSLAEPAATAAEPISPVDTSDRTNPSSVPAPSVNIQPEVAPLSQQIELSPGETMLATQSIERMASVSRQAKDLLPEKLSVPASIQVKAPAPTTPLNQTALSHQAPPPIQTTISDQTDQIAPSAALRPVDWESVPSLETAPLEITTSEDFLATMVADTAIAPTAIAPGLIAQSDVDAQNKGKLPLIPPQIESSPAPILLPETKPPSAPASDSLPQIQVRQINVVGSTVLSPETIAAIVQPLEGQSVTFAALQNVADQLTQVYLKAGYLTSRAVIKPQTVQNGVVEIAIREGALAQVEIIGLQRLSEKYIRQRLQRGIQTPLNQPQLEDQLRLLKLDPLLSNVEASLRQGDGAGESVLTVRVAEAPAIFGTVGFDNDSVVSVGSERVGGTIGYRNLTGLGDQVYASYYRSLTGGTNLWDFSYQLPLNPMQGTLQLRAAPSRYRITNGAFKDFDISGSSAFYDVSVRQPLQRSPRSEFALSLGVAHRRGETLISDVLLDKSVTSVIRFGPDWLKRDAQGVWTVNSQMNFGTGLLGATQDQTPDGQFFSWTGEVTRTQFLNLDNALRLRANWQLTPDALLPSQQFILGGRNSLRGFRQNFRSGDNGLSLSIEHQVTLKRNIAGVSIVQLAPFIDMGWVWNASHNPTPTPAANFLASLGVGLRWQPTEKWDLRLDYGLPLVRPDDRGRNLQDASVYFGVNYRF